MDITALLFLVGRILLGGYFLWNGIMHLVRIDALTNYAISAGVPYPRVAVLISSPFILLGGLGVLLGVYTEWALYLLILFMIPVTPMMHAFWKISDPNERTIARVQFLKNVALLGAILMLLLIPSPWPLSLM